MPTNLNHLGKYVAVYQQATISAVSNFFLVKELTKKKDIF